MGLTTYAALIGGLLVVDAIVMVLLAMTLKTKEARRLPNSAQRRWTTRRGILLTLGNILILLIIAVLVYPLVRRTPDAAWIPVMPIDGHFSVELPGRPEVNTSRQQTASGYLVQHAVSFVREHGLSFTATSIELPPTARVNANPIGFLNNWRDSLAAQQHLTLKHSRVITQRGVTGIEVACVHAKDGPMRFRCFVVKSRLYSLWAGPVAEREHAPEVQHFFDSFQVE